jgi:hypothetical protein
LAEITFLPIPDGDRIQYCINVILKEAKLEDRLTKQLFYHMLSMYTNDPRNIGVNSPTGEGKNYVIRKVADLFPKEDVIKFVGMSDKSLFHRPGKLVIKNDAGEYEFIEERLDKIDEDIENKSNELATTNNRDLKQALKAQIRELEKEKKNLYKDAKKLIDLSHKTIIFLDTPRPELLNAIISLLSHDEYEVEYDFVDTNNGIKTRTNVLRGWPVFIFAQAVDFSHHKRYPEIQRRFTITNPRMDEKKYAAAIDLIFDKYSMPDFMYQRMVVSDQEKDQAREIIEGLKQKIFGLTGAVFPGKNNVCIPFKKAIREVASTKRASDMTMAERICGYLTLLAQVNIDKRPIISFRRKGHALTEKIPLATLEDLKEALFLMQYSNGVRPYIQDWFNEVFLPTYNKKSEPDFKIKWMGPHEQHISENRIAVTSQELADATFEIKGKKISAKQVRESYLFTLINEGYIDTQASELDRRAEIYFPVVTENEIVGTPIIGQRIGDTAVFGESPIFDTQTEIRSSILTLLEIDLKDAIVQTKNMDELMEFYKDTDKYFTKKEDKSATDNGSKDEDREKNNSIEGNLQPISNGAENEPGLIKEAQKYEIGENPLNRLSGIKPLDNEVFPNTNENNPQTEPSSNTTSTHGFSCYYCDFDANSKDDYERHGVIYQNF